MTYKPKSESSHIAIKDRPRDPAAMQKWEEEVQKVYDFNMSIVMKVNDSVDPMSSDKTVLFQQYMNNYMYGDKVLDVDGMRGPATQKAFKEWKSWSRYAGSHMSPTDFTIGPRLYDIRTSNRTEHEKTMAIDSLYQARKDLPIYEK